MSPTETTIAVDKICAGDRRQLAKSITQAESTREIDRRATNSLIDALLPKTGRAIRIGISGTPGVGKSTFIESLGQHLCTNGHRVAVLSIDPSSSVNGGSILGDKTRMPGLATNPMLYQAQPRGHHAGWCCSQNS